MILWIHLVANALLLLLGYYWLGVGESSGPRLLWSAVVLLAFASLALLLHGATLVYFGEADRRFEVAVRRTVRNLLPLLALAAVVAVLYSLLALWRQSFDHYGFVLASSLTLHVRVPVKPQTAARGLVALLWLVRGVLLPALLLPLLRSVAADGWRGLRFPIPSRRLYWLQVALLLWVAAYVPLWLFYWIPRPSAFGLQVLSLILRIGTGYLLFVGALLAVEYFTSAGKPLRTQPNTTGSL